MDSTDKKILYLLKQNARMPLTEMSKIIHLSVPAVSERIRKMEESGIITKYEVRIDRDKLNYKLLAFIFVNIETTKDIEPFRETMAMLPAVLECHHLAGEYDYLLKVVCLDTQDLEQFISSELKSIHGVQKTNTIITLSSIKEEINQ
ncbi:winged helix-turn-helix transcriptional regulator [Terrilactibacillus sp. BCM23-1]|uniref:Winged helix-turn-helix transcriptional regulator n=1 Tax=Terrilactibacillus tamarindi TaxID=2599694 RepID=A0A6N8CUJ9_9BACI|nr:Lrp/AsnC family transcriptional regulator [Terrilactibacillus tamarindi]MTT33017.1 winged helix-turn-helix transcriptional regulator [Terrilactibacillus tamarindi]